MTSNPKPFPAVPYSAQTFPGDEYLIVPKSIASGWLSADAVQTYLLLTALAEGHRSVELPPEQLEQHTGLSAAEIGDAVAELESDRWLTITKGSAPGTRTYTLRRMPSVATVQEWAQDLREPPSTAPSPAHRPAGPADPKQHSAFWLGRVADPQSRQ
ncbi:hypothetical protein [Nonomuraea maritima]|uniref:hypothetical protein n=1 Tax=Nonomuraea maritima TaxID=683260 RepID=UPI0037212D3B